jgi:dTDP-glucose pyrophosphorylase
MIPNCAIVLAAGLGTRMRPYNGSIPKQPLVQVRGNPLIDFALERLAEAGVERVVVNVHPSLMRWRSISQHGKCRASSFRMSAARSSAQVAASPMLSRNWAMR